MCCVSCIVYKYIIYIHCIVHIDNTVYLDIYKMCVQNKCALCTAYTINIAYNYVYMNMCNKPFTYFLVTFCAH